MTSTDPPSTTDLIVLVQKTRQKLQEAAAELGELTRELRKRLEEEDDD